MERKKTIDDAFALVGEADHYELLGVPRTAAKKEIRAAYFELAKLFHTDTLFGVDLADYRGKMDKVFQALTEAYEVLSKNKKRRAYDAYLGVVQETKPLDEVPVSMLPPKPEPEPEPEAEPEARPSKPRPLRDPVSRREMARKMAEKRLRPASSARVDRDATVRSLARTLQAVSQTSSKHDRATRLIADAAKAEAEGNITGAAEALRIAAAWRPDDPVLAAKAEELRSRALQIKVPAYEKRARYAERNEQWDEAALCWSRVVEARPTDAFAAMSAASAFVKARGDLKEAARLAKLASDLAPKDVQCQRVLAEVYLAAGMPASAKRALEAALRADPSDSAAKEMLREISS